jgi:hypothetical protein
MLIIQVVSGLPVNIAGIAPNRYHTPFHTTMIRHSFRELDGLKIPSWLKPLEFVFLKRPINACQRWHF